MTTATAPRLNDLKLLVRRRSVAYFGWLGYGNMGDEALFDAADRLLGGETPLRPFPQGRRLSRLIAWAPTRLADAVVLGGGTLIGTATFREALEAVRSCGPAFTFGSGVEDPQHDGSGQVAAELDRWAELLAGFQRVTVRGPLSAELLRERGVAADVVGDPALALPRWYPGAPAPAAEPVLGLNIAAPQRGWGADPERLVEVLETVAREKLRQGWRVRIVPLWARDLEVARALAQRLGDRAELFAGFERLPLLLEAISGCTTVVGVKLHSVIFASAYGVPSVMLGYERKCDDFMASVGRDRYTLRTDRATAADVLASLADLEADLPGHRREIAAAVAQRCVTLDRLASQLRVALGAAQ